MKLKNKKTGILGTPRVSYQEFYIDDENGYTYNYKSLQKMYEEWEDYEEPKENYILNFNGDTLRWDNDKRDRKITKQLQEIGNYFSSEEEAELTVEKLKAFKRLKDKGFRFDGIEVFSEGLLKIDGVLSALGGADNAERLKIIDDLDTCFGGEE